MTAVLAAAAMWIGAWRMRSSGAPRSATLAAVLLLLIYDTAAFRFTPRPQTFGWVCLGVLMWLFERSAAQRALRPLWGVPVLALLWANLHSSSLLVVVFLGALGVGNLVSLRGRWRVVVVPRWRSLLLLGLATLIAVFLTPNPTGRLQATVAAFFSQYSTGRISEWQSPSLNVWLGPVGLLMLLTVLSLVLDRRKVGVPEVLVSATATWLGFRHIRFLPILALVNGPLAYRHLTNVIFGVQAGDEAPPAVRGWRRVLERADGWLAAGLLAVFVLGALGLDNRSAWVGGVGRPKGELVGRAYPEGATSFLARERPQGHMYNTFHFGGYLIYHLGPQVKVFVDGRTPNVYDDAHMRDVMEIRRNWRRTFARWDVEYAVIQHGEMEDELAADPGWSLVYFDDVALVLVRNDGSNAELAQRLAYRELRPPFSRAPESEEQRVRMGVEAERVVRESPYSSLAHILRGRVRALRNDVTGFEGDMRTASQLDPLRPEPWQRLGMLALERGQYGEAARNLARAHALKPEQPALRLQLAAAYWASGQQAAAIEILQPLAVRGRTLDDLVATVARMAQGGPRAQPRP
jgi:hypothetical protein